MFETESKNYATNATDPTNWPSRCNQLADISLRVFWRCKHRGFYPFSQVMLYALLAFKKTKQHNFKLPTTLSSFASGSLDSEG